MVKPIRTVEQSERAERRLGRLGGRVDRLISILALVRLVTFLIALLCGSAALIDAVWLPYGPISIAAFLVFLISVQLHRKPFNLQPRVKQAAENVRLSQARLNHQWTSTDTGDDHIDLTRPELSELRVFGSGSVYQQSNRSGLSLSQSRLAARLRDGVELELIPQLHDAARALQNAVVFRRRMETESRLLAILPKALEDTLAWSEDREPPIPRLGLLRVISAVLCLATPIQLVLELGFELQTAWQITLLLQVLLFSLTTGPLGLSYAFMIGDTRSRPLSALLALFKRAETFTFDAPYLVKLQAQLRAAGSKPMYEELERFNGIVDRLSVRHGPMLHSILGIGLGWELHNVGALQRWRARIGTRVRTALTALSDLEIVLGMCGFAEEVGAHVYPRVDVFNNTKMPLQFEGVGHPCIQSAQRRYNDFAIDHEGELALVTGSNMSGKSTFLRTVGINVLLARAGFPVCARQAVVTYCSVISSIQVTDRPEEGLSRFHAEVKRLKAVLDMVNHSEIPTLYLVDEMLSGTNSRERAIACRSVLRQLQGQTGAFGIVTTHDLELAKDRDGPPLSYYHFADRFDGTALHFDYQLRDGVATTTNAIRVLEIEGIRIQT